MELATGYRLLCRLVRQLPLFFDDEHLTYRSCNDIGRCGPCRAIAPTYEALSKQYSNVNFLKCNVDVAKDVATEYSVTAMCVYCLPRILLTNTKATLRPTFIFLKGGVKGRDRSWCQQKVTV